MTVDQRHAPNYKAMDPDAAANAVAGLITGTGGGDGSGKGLAAGTYYSRATDIEGATLVTDIWKWTGTVAGTGTYEVSDSSADEVKNGVDTWVPYTLARGSMTLTGAAGSDFAELLQMGFSRLRAKVVISAGTGTLLIQRTVKKVG